MVADAFQVCDGAQVLADRLVLRLCHFTGCQLHQVAADFILIPVHNAFQRGHFVKFFFREVVQQGNSHIHGLLRQLRHFIDGQPGLFNRQGGIRKETFLQPVHIPGVCLVRRIAGDQGDHQLLNQRDEQRQHDNGGYPEQGIQQGDGEHIHHFIHEGEPQHRVQNIEHSGEQDHLQDLNHQVGYGRAPAVPGRTHTGKQHRYRSADGDTQDDGQRHIKRNQACGGQRLQDTDGSGSALEHSGKDNTDQDPQERIGKAGQEGDKARILLQDRNRTAHGFHAEHQHRKTHEDIRRVMHAALFGDMFHQDCADSRQGRQRLRTQQLQEGGGSASGHAGKADNPARNTGTDDCAHDNGDGLAQFHHGRVHKADHHDAGGGRGLDHRGDPRTKQNALKRCGGKPVQNQFQLIAGNFFQSVTHQRHTVQEHRHPTQEQYKIQKFHFSYPPSACFPDMPHARPRSSAHFSLFDVILPHESVAPQGREACAADFSPSFFFSAMIR